MNVSFRKPSVLKEANPIVQEYLESYGGVVSFKEDLSKLLMDKGANTFKFLTLGLCCSKFNRPALVA